MTSNLLYNEHMTNLLNKLVMSLMGQNALYLAEWPLSCSHHNAIPHRGVSKKKKRDRRSHKQSSNNIFASKQKK